VITRLSKAKAEGLKNLRDAVSDALRGESWSVARAHIAAAGLDRNLLFKFPDELGQTLLHHAIDNVQVDQVRLLLECGADANYNHNYRTPLQMAAQVGSVEILELLLAHKAKLNGRDLMLKAPAISVAILNNHEAAALFLLERGIVCDESVLDANSRSAATLAIERDLPMVALALAKAGAVDGDLLARAVPRDAYRIVEACFADASGRAVEGQELKQLLALSKGSRMRQILRSACAQQAVAGALMGDPGQIALDGPGRAPVNIL
jgi:hypothetical protein